MKPKHLHYLLLLFGTLLLINCQTEEIPVAHGNHEHSRQVAKVSLATFKKLTGLADFKTTFEFPIATGGFMARDADGKDTPEDFIVDADPITQTIVDGKTSYSFALTPKEGIKPGSRYYLVVYDKGGVWLDMIIESKVATGGDGIEKEVTFREIYASAARGTGCTTVFTWVIECNGRGKCADGVCDLCSQCLRADSHRICGGKDEEDFYDDSWTIPGQPGGGGGNPDPDPDPDPEDPIEDEVIVTLPGLTGHPKDNPCEKLGKLKDAAGYSEMIAHLKGKALGRKEYGKVYKYFPNSTVFAPPTTAGQLTSNPAMVDLSAFNDVVWVGAFHNHTEPISTDAIQMFSPGDVLWLFRKGYKAFAAASSNRTPYDPSELFLGLVVNNGVYCLKIKDGDKLNRLAPVFEKFKKDLVDLNRIDKPTASKTKHETSFLKMLIKYDIGIGLYEQDSQGNWNELELDPQNNENDPIKKPCS